MTSKDRSKRDTRLAAEERRKERAYWEETLAGDWNPAQFHRDPSSGSPIDSELTVKFQFDELLARRLIGFCGGSDITIHVLLVAATHALVGLLDWEEAVDNVILTPILRQEGDTPFINTILPIRCQFKKSVPFKELLLAARDAVADGDEHLNFPLIDTFPMIREIGIAVLLEHIHDARHFEPLKPALVWSFSRQGNGLTGKVSYDGGSFRPEAVELLTSRFVALVRQALANVETPVGQLDLFLAEEKKRLLETFDNCGKSYPLDDTLDGLFIRQVERTPHAVALRSEEGNLQLSYNRLRRSAVGIAGVLRQQGIADGHLVGILGDPSVDVALAVWGVLMAGAAYVPIEPALPVLRREYVAKDCRLSLVLEEGDECLREIKPTLAVQPDHGPGDAAYVIYTSGSTGSPKGVVVEHRGVVNYVLWARQMYLDEDICGFPFFSPLAFDLTVTSLFVPLVSGNSAIVMSKSDSLAMLQNIFHHPLIHVVKLTPSHLKMVVDLAPAKSAVRRLIVGGEELTVDLASSVLRHFNHTIAIFNEYGPTETVVGCMIHRFDPERDHESVPIGFPAANTRIFILDETYRLLPPGGVGELCISGAGVARGYLNHPDKTADSFVNDPFRPGERMYRSGDLAYYTIDGPMEFAGRLDSQIKIRGFRVEPGEVEAALRLHPSVSEAVAAVRKQGQDDGLLCAYVVASRESDAGEALFEELREFLTQRLPEHMIPARIIPLTAIPLTVNGKVDTGALPDAPPAENGDSASPRHDADRKLLTVWSEVLELSEEEIGIDANYFRLGGHSLSAVRLLSRIHRQFNVKIPLAEFFRIPHIRGLGDYISNAAGERFAPVRPVEEKEYYQLSSAQTRIFILQTIDLQGTGYNTPMVAELSGPLLVDTLGRVFSQLIRRHECFRTSFKMLENRPVQTVHQEVEFALEFRDSAQWEDNGPESVNREIEHFIAPFDLASAPLLRAMVIRLSAERHVLVFDMHHIVADGVSLKILASDFMDLYAGKTLPPLSVQYRDYAYWQQDQRASEELEAQKRYWRTRFSGSVPLLDLPADYRRRDIMSDAGRLEEFALEANLTLRIKKLAETEGTTLFMALLAVFNVLLSRLSGQEDIVVGTPVAGRPHVDLEGIIGMFVNTLALRNFPVPTTLFRDFLEQLKTQTVEDFANQDYPFEDLVDNLSLHRDTGRNPLFDVMLALQNMDIPEVAIPGLTLSPYGYEHRKAKFDLILNGEEVGDEIHFVAEYSTDLYSRATILRIIDYFKRLLSEISENPRRAIGEYRLVSAEEQEEILHTFNRNRSDIFGFQPDELAITIQNIFLQRVDAQRDIVALAADDRNISFGELRARASRLARILIEGGAGPESIVAIMTGRSEIMIVGLLGILMAGAAYLPIDPNYPPGRQEFMLRDSAASMLLGGGPSLIAEGQRIDLDEALVDGLPECDAFEPGRPSDPAFVLYTSGTTGRPKGVIVEHRQGLNVLSWFGQTYGLGRGGQVALLTEYTFDPSVNQIFGTLLWGGTLHVLGPQLVIYKDMLRRYISSRQIQLVYQVPSFLKELLDRQPPLPSLRIVISGGDRLDDDLKDRLLAAGYKLYNHYGPTETGVDACASACDSANVTIGTPLPNARAVVLGPCGTLQPVGVAGELCISGQGVAPGYLNRPELTAERFVPHPFFEGEVMYKSGDAARFLADGSLEFLGRIDQQVKIRGFRVETEEIRALLIKHPFVIDAAIVAVPLATGERHLAAFIVAKKEEIDWTDYLASQLPYYMVPSRFITIDGIPVTANGKVDRARLRKMAETESTAADFTPPQDQLERQVAEIWTQVLGLDEVGVLDNFFDRGGNSLQILQVNGQLKTLMKRDIPVVMMFKYPTIRSLARYLKGEEGGEAPKDPGIGESRVSNGLNSNDVAVIGMAGRFPGAPDVATFWKNLNEGVESVSFFSKGELEDEGIDARWLNHPDYVRAAAILENKQYFDAAFFEYSPNEALIMDPQIRIFHECAWAALEDAGYCPDTYEGRIGVYAGAANNFYWQGLVHVSGHGDTLGPFATAQLSNRDYLCARVAYKLNLRGPAVLVHSACSTSLVAIHTAYRSVLAGECQMALAGGVTLAATQKYGYIYQEGMVNSPDGHCRAFDIDARGTVSGEGAGVVVLKPLDAACTDRDNIYAVVKGSSANNDGVRRVGFSAPSVEGQAEVIGDALAMAGVDPETIGYVETHGTGTVLGDPIEVEGLKTAFQSSKTGFCRIGSVKTNVGHLDTAAGVAGFIKTVLALGHRRIPPSLNFDIPNPNIDFGRSPFVVCDSPTPWSPSDEPLRAGVSSFGIGGTNAHVILQEAPVLEAEDGVKDSPERYLLCLSARSDAALRKLSSNLADHLRRHRDVDLGDVCYTMAVGRRPMDCRKIVLFSNRDEAALGLENNDSPQVKVFRTKRLSEERPVVFMFAGLGSQYEGMADGLYRDEPVFRREIDRCAAILNPLLDYDILSILFTPPANGKQTTLLQDIDISQLTVFMVEYAVARLLLSWGIRPRAVVGYSFGEYAAACVAGIFELEDVLPLLVERGRLLKQLPPGGMLSIPLPRNKALAHLSENLSIAIDNGSSVVVAGPRQEILDTQAQLLEKKIFTVLLPAQQAMHSIQVEPVLNDFSRALEKVSFKAPDIPLVSNVTGVWITAAQALNPDYWVRHLRETVQFDAALKCLLSNGSPIFVEIGPGRDLCNLTSRYCEGGRDCEVLPTIRQPQKDVSDTLFLTRQLGNLWLYGGAIDWRNYYSGETYRRVSLPSYPFEGKKYWIEGNLASLATQLADKGDDNQTRGDIGDWFYLPSWELSIQGPDSKSMTNASSCLVFLDDGGLGDQLLEGLTRRFTHVLTVQPAAVYTFDGSDFYIRPGEEDDYRRLVSDFSSVGVWPCLVVHLWGVGTVDSMDLGGQLCEGFFSLSYFGGALDAVEPERRKGTEIVAVCNGLGDILGDEDLMPAKAGVLGPCRVIPLEIPGIRCRLIDIVWPDSGQRKQQFVIRSLLEEILWYSGDAFVALRGQKRWTQSYKPVRLEKTAGPATYVRRNGVYLITGALGEHGSVGYFLARWLGRQTECSIAFVGRTPLPPQEEWAAVLETANDAAVASRIQKLLDLRDCGVRVMYLSADVAELGQMEEALNRVEERFGPVNGVVHAAAVMGEGTIRFIAEQESKDNILRQLRPKISGSAVLYQILKDRDLDFCVLMSSLASHLGGIGVNTYTAANNVCDAFVHWVNRDDRRRWISINWDNWQKSGRPVEEENPLAMPIEDGVEAFHRILSWGAAGQVITSTVALDFWLKKRMSSDDSDTQGESQLAALRYPSMEDWFYQPQWQAGPLDPANSVAGDVYPKENWLVFAGESELSRHTLQALEGRGISTVIVTAGKEFREISNREFTIDPTNEADYNRLFDSLAQAGMSPGFVLHMWNLDFCGPQWLELDHIDKSLDCSLHSVLSIVRGIGTSGIDASIRLGVVTCYMQPVMGGEPLNPHQAAVLGPLKIIPLEYADIACKSIDTDEFIKAEQIIVEMIAPFEGFEEVAYRDGERMAQNYTRLPLRSETEAKIRLKMDAVYLVTGGLGGMGLAIARFLVETYRSRVILVDRDHWPGSVPGVESGDRYFYFQADVADLDRMREVVREAEQMAGSINGVIHTAGDIDTAGVIQRRSRRDTVDFLRPKILGALVLDTIFRHHSLDFTVLFSSLGNVLYGGKFGQVAYNAGHEFMDVFAAYKYRAGAYTVTIDWNDWEGIGMAGRAAERFASDGGNDVRLSISRDQGLRAFVLALELDVPRLAVSAYDLGVLAEYINYGKEVLRGELELLDNQIDGAAGIVEPRPQLDVEFVPPGNEVEKQLAAIWKSFFAIDRIGIDDDFFELGGDSLKAMTVATKIQRQLQVKIPLPELFKRSTIRTLSQFISRREKDETVPVSPVEKKDYYVLSAAQKRLFVMQQIDESSTVYNESTAIVFPHAVEKELLVKVFEQLIHRHESLRTYFILVDGEPVQRVIPAGGRGFTVDAIDNTGASGKILTREELLSAFIRPFRLHEAPLLRVVLVKEGDHLSMMMVDLHHIVTDGHSMELLRREFLELYNGGALRPLQIQYKDYAEWQHAPQQVDFASRQLEYWRLRFSDPPQPLRLPVDFPRSGAPGFEGEIIRLELDQAIGNRLRELAAEEDVTLFMLLLAMVYLWLNKISGQEDIVVGTLTAGRPHPDLEAVMGMFVNTLALRQTVNQELYFREWLRQVKRHTIDAFGNQDCQFDQVVEALGFPRESGRNPLFDVMFVLKKQKEPSGGAPGTPDPYEFKTQISKFDLIVIGNDSGQNISLTFTYGTHLFRRLTIQRLSGYINEIIDYVLEQPDIKLKDMELSLQLQSRVVEVPDMEFGF